MFLQNADLEITRNDRARPSSMDGYWVVGEVRQEIHAANLLSAANIQHYLPLISGWERNGAKKRRRCLRPLYRNYIFICCREYDEQDKARHLDGCYGTIEVKDAAGLTSSLDNTFDKIAAGTISEADFDSDLIGRVCHVKAGPWRGRDVTPELLAKRGRLICPVQTLGRLIPVEIPVECLEAV